MIAPAGPVVVSSPGTPVSAVSNLPVNARPYLCHGVLFQAVYTNTGNVYIGVRGMNKTTLVGVFAVLLVPTENIVQSFSAALTITPNGMCLNDFYVDADQPGEGALVTYLVT